MNDNDGNTAPFCPQRSTTLKRRWCTVQEKLCLVRTIKRKIDCDHVSVRNACIDSKIHIKQYLTWVKEINALEEAKKKNLIAKSLCIGRTSILKPIEGELACFIFELREQGMGVTISMVRLKAILLSRDFREKSSNAQYHATRRFITSLGLVYRMATHELQKGPQETKAETLDFLRSMHHKLTQPC